MASRAEGDTPCKCGNTNKDLFLRYLHDDDDEGLLGVFCTKCGREWLKEKHLKSSNCDDFIRFCDIVLLLNKRKQATHGDFKVQYNRTKIENFKYAVDQFKAGDHILWEREVYDHHAIVEKVNVKENSMDVIEYKKGQLFSVEVKRDTLVFDTSNITNLYRIDYDEGVTDSHYLVIARARAWLGQKGYNLFTRNCETFSVYCVIGTLVSWQTVCLLGQITRCIRATVTKTCFKTSSKVAFAEVVESATTGDAMCNVIGGGIIIAIESTAIAIDLKNLYIKRKQGGLSWKDFLHNTIERVVKGLTMAGFVIGGSIGGEIAGAALGSLIFPGVGTLVGMFLGSIIGGVVAAVPGKLCGSFMGSKFGRAIAATVKNDDRLVTFTEVKEGDQIVMCAWFLHPRCHAIVTGVNRQQRTLSVIRNTHAEGVIEEVLNFVPPVYRVVYLATERYSVEETILRARSKIGEQKYNIISYNCKHFACWCIQKETKRLALQ